MNHGRSSARGMLLAAALLLCGPVFAQDAPAPLHLAWEQPSHASGIYHVKADATLTVVVDNISDRPADLSGELLFGSLSEAPAGKEDFKALSVTPLAPATVAGHQRVKIPLAVTFGAAGSYALRWKHADASDPIDSATGVTLQCIFAPRSALAATGPADTRAATKTAGDESPWLTLLPPAAVRTPGFLGDYAAQTSVSRFLIDERFAYDPATNVGLGFGASTGAGARELDAFFAQAARAGEKPQFTLRLTVPVAAADTKTVNALKEYLADAIRRGRGTLSAIALVPALPTAGLRDQAEADALRRHYTTLYLVAYETAKRADRNLQFLGAGSAMLTAQWLAPDAKLLSYIDALAITDAAAEPLLARRLLAGRNPPAKIPLYVLPPLPDADAPWPPPAAALAQGAAIVAVPAPPIDHGVTAHLLGAAVLLQRVQLAAPTPDAPPAATIPFIAVFQGDHYAVAAIAGFSAGTDLDAAYPALARTRTQVEPPGRKSGDPGDPAYPHLFVSDDTRSMVVVDAAGDPVDCRVGDSLFVPAGDALVYLLQGGSAEDLAGSLRPALARNLPLFEVTLQQTPDGAWSLHLRNCTTREVGGTARLLQPLAPSNPAEAATVLAEKDFPPVSPDKLLEIPLSPAGQMHLAPHPPPLVVEITTSGTKPLTQRTAVVPQ